MSMLTGMYSYWANNVLILFPSFPKCETSQNVNSDCMSMNDELFLEKYYTAYLCEKFKGATRKYS